MKASPDPAAAGRVKRGWLAPGAEADPLPDACDGPEHWRMMAESPIAAERTLAVRLLHKTAPSGDPGHIAWLLERLQTEKALYTRLEITSSLESSGPAAVAPMCSQLAKIGRNQHRQVPDAISKKKCFPLPRDIIARSLGRMGPDILPALLKARKSLSPAQVNEWLDALGYLVFYHPALATPTSFAPLRQVFDEGRGDELRVWKVGLGCGSFLLPESRALLREIQNTATHPTILAEAKKSLTRMDNKEKESSG